MLVLETVTVTLPTCEPELLVLDAEMNYRGTPGGLWLQFHTKPLPPRMWPHVSIRGRKDVVRKFVADNWGEEEAARLC